MKKFWSLLFVVLFALCLVACGESNEQPTENVSEKAKEYLNQAAITYAEGDSQSSVTKDVTLLSPSVEGVTVSWTSDKDAIKIEGNKGIVTRSSEEDVKVKLTFTLTYKDVTLNKPFSLTVLMDAPVVVNANEIKISGTPELEQEDEVVFTATVLPADAVDKSFVWSSSNENVATVDNTGLVTAIGVGTCNIVATLVSNDKVFAEFEVVVSEKLELSTLAGAIEAETGTKVKVRAGIVAANAQGYLLYDETAYAQYYLGANAKIDYEVGDQLEIIGALSEYNGTKQFTSDAVVAKLGSGFTTDFTAKVLDAESIAGYYEAVVLGDNLMFNVTITSVSEKFVNATIDGLDGYGVTVVYPLASTDFEVGKQYQVYGYALYGKDYNNVHYFYMMASKYGQVYTITFDTTYEATVEPIKFIDHYDVVLPELRREEYIFAGWMEGADFVEEITENRDYNLVASLFKRDYEAVQFDLVGGEFEFNQQFYIGNYNNCGGIVNKYDCYTIYKKGSSSVAWASQYYLKFFMKEVEAGTNIYKIVYKAGESVAVTGDLLNGVTYDYDYIISSNASNKAGHPYFVELYNKADVLDNYWYFIVPEDCGKVCNIKVNYDLERAKVDPNNLKFEQDDKLQGAVKEYYDFVGWYDNAEYTGEPYSFHVKGITKYYAKWEATTYQVTVDLGEGATTGTLPTTYTIESEDIALPAADTMTKEGYKFLGWYDNAAGSGTPYTAIVKGSHGDLELYAVWQSNVALEKQVSEADVAVLNKVTPTKYVFTDATICNYVLKGTGLDAKYDAEINATSVFTSVANALKSAVEGDIIYVFAGTYTDECSVAVKNVTLIGPNYGVKGNATRVDEADIQGAFVISETGFTADGLKFTESAAIGIGSNDVTIQYCYISNKLHATKASGRKALIYSSVSSTITNINIKYNCLAVMTGATGYTNETIAMDSVKNLLVEGNYYMNDGTSTVTANTEDSIFYSVGGYIKFIDNEFHMYSQFELFRLAQYGSTADVLIQGNKVYGQSETVACEGAFAMYSLSATSTVTIIGNEFHTKAANALRFKVNASCPIIIAYNKFYDTAYATFSSNASLSATFTCNWFEKGAEADTFGAAASAQENAEAVDTAYAAYVAEQNRTATITFVAEGIDPIEAITFKDVKAVKLPTPEREGFEFGGWYNGETKVTAITVKEDVTLTAKWLAIYTITFDADGGDAVESMTFTDYAAVVLPQTKKDGSAFDAWYEGDTKVEALTENKNYSLKAHYITNRTVTFDADGGQAVEAIIYTDYATVTLPETTKDGFHFDGWYDGDTKVTALTESKDYTLKAKWLEIFTITFDVDGGSTVENIDFYQLTGIVLPAPTKADVMFEGWYNGETKVTAITELADITLKAKWVVPFTVTFNVDGGDAIEAIKFIDYTTVVLPVATKAGSVFEGWKDGDNAAAITENKDYSLTATWREKKTLVVDTNNAEAYQTIAAALAAANTYDTISIAAGAYTEEVTIAIANLTIVGPNAGKAGKATDRAEEAVLSGAVCINADGVTVKGLKFIENATIGVNGSNVLIADNIVNTVTHKLASDNRKGMIYGNRPNAQKKPSGAYDWMENITISNNYLKTGVTNTGHEFQAFTFSSTINLTVENNYIENVDAAPGTANTEDIMLYGGKGTLRIIGNEFHMRADAYLFRIGLYELYGEVEIMDNKFYSIGDGSTYKGAIYFDAKSGTAKASIVGNEFHFAGTNLIKTNSLIPVYFAYNKVYGPEFNPALKDATKLTYAANWFENGVATSDTSNAAASALADAAAVDAAYAKYLLKKAGYATITFNTDGGNAIEELLFIDPATVTLPTPVKEGFDFDGWYNGDTKVTAITEVADVTLVAHWSDLFTITYAFDDGATANATEQKSGLDLPYTITKAPTREGYDFAGWYNGDTKVEAITEKGDVTLTAHWNKIYTITYDFDGGKAPVYANADEAIDAFIAAYTAYYGVTGVVKTNWSDKMESTCGAATWHYDDFFKANTEWQWYLDFYTKLTTDAAWSYGIEHKYVWRMAMQAYFTQTERASWPYVYANTAFVNRAVDIMAYAPTKDSATTTTSVLPYANLLTNVTKADVAFAGWYNGDTKVTSITVAADITLKAKWVTPTPLEVAEADAALIAQYKPSILVSAAFADDAIYSYNGANYYVGVNAFKDLDAAIAAANNGAAIYLFAATTYTLNKKISNAVTIVSASAAATTITVKATIDVKASVEFNGATLVAGSGIKLTVDTDHVNFTVKNCVVDWNNTFYTCYDDHGSDAVVTFDNVEFVRAGQFIAWITLGASISVTNCKFNLSNKKLGTIGSVSYNTALFRIRSGNMVFNNNYVTGTMPNNPFLIEYTVIDGTMTAMYNTFEDTTAPIYMNAAGTATYNKNIYITAGAPAAAPTITSKIQNGAVLNLDTVFYGSKAEVEAIAAIAAEFLTDFNAKVGKGNTAETFDSEHMDGSDLAGFLADATYGAKWAWFVTAIYTNCGQLEAADPAAAGQDYSASAVKGFYIVNIKAFFLGATQHDKNFNVDSVTMTADIQKAILNAKAN